MNVHFLNSQEKKKVLAELEEIYGITELNYLMFETGKKKIRGFSGSLTKEELIELSKITNIELIGMYLVSKKDESPRINFDAISLLREQITKRIIEIDLEQLNKWIRGQDLDVAVESGVVVLKYGGDLVGLGKSNGEKIFNYVPKERKVKARVI